MKPLEIIFPILFALVTASVWAQEPDASMLTGLEATVYKSPTCG